MVRLGMLARMRRVVESPGCCSPCPGSSQAKAEVSGGARWAGWPGDGGRMWAVRAGVLRAQRLGAHLGICPPCSTPSLGMLLCVPKAWCHECSVCGSGVSPSWGCRQEAAPGTHTVPILPLLRLPCFTSAPLLQLQLCARLCQDALLLDELAEGGVHGSFIVRAQLLAAGTQSSNHQPGSGDGVLGKPPAPAQSRVVLPSSWAVLHPPAEAAGSHRIPQDPTD